MISGVKIRKLLRKGCHRFLSYLINNPTEMEHIYNIPFICEFPDVFPLEWSSIALVREIDSMIDLVLGAEPISRTPYRMGPVELKELKEQLENCWSKVISTKYFPLGSTCSICEKERCDTKVMH